jgi:hypothetical protein
MRTQIRAAWGLEPFRHVLHDRGRDDFLRRPDRNARVGGPGPARGGRRVPPAGATRRARPSRAAHQPGQPHRAANPLRDYRHRSPWSRDPTQRARRSAGSPQSRDAATRSRTCPPGPGVRSPCPRTYCAPRSPPPPRRHHRSASTSSSTSRATPAPHASSRPSEWSRHPAGGAHRSPTNRGPACRRSESCSSSWPGGAALGTRPSWCRWSRSSPAHW